MQTVTRIPRLVIAGTHSGVGKTTVTTGLIAAFARRGMRVQPFKVGPDFIDPGFHHVASGRVSRNLDGWMLSRSANLEIFARACADADIAIIEGVMGLFDGRYPLADDGSTAEMAKWLEAPVLLVADASAMARSAAAVIGGFEAFDPQLDLAGVLFNRVGGPRHVDILREAVTGYCRSAIAGFLPKNSKIAMPSRHLGLTMATEALTGECLDEMVAWVEGNVDLDALLKLACEHSPALDTLPAPVIDQANSKVRIAVARDAAFCFYYQDNLDLLAECGAELVEFSPTLDAELPPDTGGVYLGGGYPELHGERLSQNLSMLQSIRALVQAGGPVYAECGGFMYLTKGIVDIAGTEYPMAGVFPTRVRMQAKLAALGYVQPRAVHGMLWLDADESMRGHQFRYSAMDPMPPEIARAYEGPEEAYSIHSVLGSYVHLHFRSCRGFAERFVQHCSRWSEGKTI